MSNEPAVTSQIRASDAEREQVAKLLSEAGSEGRLSLEEVDERLAAVYATKFRDELPQFTADLPQPPEPRPRRQPPPWVRQRLIVHMVIVAVLSVMLIGRWGASGAGFFWPAFPMMWLWGSVAVHAAISRRYRVSS